MRITLLQPQANDPNRINIFADNQFLLGVNALSVLQMELKVGQELTETQLERLRDEESLQQSVDRALNFLSFRPRSREEVRRYLRRKNTTPEVSEQVMERLERMGLVNDHSFATFWIESREQFNPRGSQALKNELRMKGVQRDVVDELVSSDQDEERAMRAAEKKAYSLLRQAEIDYQTFRNKLGSFLQRRGFNYEVTTKTVKAWWQTLRSDQDEDEETTDFE